MSGTAFGTIILHVTPEAAIGGSIGLVHNGDEISLSISNKILNLNVSKDQMIDLIFASKICKHTKSNAIVLVKNNLQSRISSQYFLQYLRYQKNIYSKVFLIKYEYQKKFY